MKLPTQASPVIRTNKISRISQIMKEHSLIFAAQWPPIPAGESWWDPDALTAAREALLATSESCNDIFQRGITPETIGQYITCLYNVNLSDTLAYGYATVLIGQIYNYLRGRP